MWTATIQPWLPLLMPLWAREFQFTTGVEPMCRLVSVVYGRKRYRGSVGRVRWGHGIR